MTVLMTEQPGDTVGAAAVGVDGERLPAVDDLSGWWLEVIP